MAKLRLENGDLIEIPDNASPEDAQKFLDQARTLQGNGASAKPDTFLGESGLEGMGNLLSSIQNSGHTFNPSDAWNILKGMYQGQAAETGQEEGQAIDQLKQGNLPGALSHFIAGTPLIGHPLVHAAHNIVSGNYGGATGDLLSLFGPKAADLATEGMSNGAREAGLQLYRRNLPFTSASSPADIKAATEAGVDQALPAQSAFSKQGNSLDRIGSSKEPGTILGNLEKEAQQYVGGQAGSLPINTSTALSPFVTKLKQYLNSNSASVINAGKGMLKEAQPGLEKLDPAVMQKVFEVDPKTGDPIYTPQQQAHLIEMWANSGPKNITVATAHAAKRDAYDALNSNVFNDKNAGNAAPAGAKDANLALSAGYKNAVNEVQPQMAGVNDQMHNILTLKSALNEAAKASPKEFSILTNLAIGGLAGSTAVMRGGGMAESAGAGLAGVIALQALKSPRVATQLGILLGKRFPQVTDALRPFVGPAAMAGSAGAQGLRSGDQQIQNLFNPTGNH